MNILINKINNIVEGVNISPTPFNYSIDVEDNFTLTKTIEEQEGEKQKVNEQEKPLYLKEVYKTETKEVVIGQDETIDVTDKPIMLKVQKQDEEGNKLYLEAIVDENGQQVDSFETINSEDDFGNINEPIMIEVPKLSTSGKPLYLKDIIEIVPYQVLDHVEEVTENEDNYEPIMIPNMVNNTYTLKEHPNKFSVLDILEAKYQKVLEDSQKDYIIADMFLNEEDLDLEDPNHSANTGVAHLQLLPNGQAKTKSITLEAPTTNFEILEFKCDEGVEIYLSGKKFVDGKLTLASPISNCTIKFVNNTDIPKKVKSFAIGY